MGDRRPVWLTADEIALISDRLDRALSGGAVPEWDQDVCDCIRALEVDWPPWLTVNDDGRAVRMVPAVLEDYYAPVTLYRAVPVDESGEG